MKQIHYFRDGLTFCAITTFVMGAGTQVIAQNQPATENPATPRAAAQQQRGTADQTGRQPEAQQQGPVGLGFHFEKQASSGRGLEIATVDPNSPAAQAGLQPHDRLVSVDGHAFTQARHAKAYLSAQTGRPVPLVVDRNGNQQMLQIVPGRPVGDNGWLGILLVEENENGQQTPGTQPNAAGGKQNAQGSSPSAPAATNSTNAAQNAPGQKGARVAEVYPGSPAARAGLRPGDLVTQIDGKKIDDSAELVAVVYEMKPQTKADFEVMRDNQQQKIPVTIGSRNNEYAESQFGPEQWGQFGPGQGGQEFGNPNALHQLEEEMRQLRDEIRQLREQLQKK